MGQRLLTDFFDMLDMRQRYLAISEDLRKLEDKSNFLEYSYTSITGNISF